MYSGFESEILAISRTDYLLLYLRMLAFFAYLVYYCYATIRRLRFIDGTATSKIRSATSRYALGWFCTVHKQPFQ